MDTGDRMVGITEGTRIGPLEFRCEIFANDTAVRHVH